MTAATVTAHHALDVIGAPVAVAAGIVVDAGVIVGLPDWVRQMMWK